MAWKIPLADVKIGEEEKQAVVKVLESGWLTMGGQTAAFEENFAEFLGVKHAFAVSSCTAALHLACQVLDLNPGDEIILPSLTFVATANAVCYTGAAPIFADITSEEDLTISPEDIEKRITPKTRAIMIMHYAGYPCNMEAISDIAKRHNLVLIEDAAHAVGATLNDRPLGTWGDMACFSFFSNKNMTTGEGGMIITNDDHFAEKIRLLRSHGMTTLTWDRHKGHAHSYDVVDVGYNYRIDEIRSAIGIEQLRKLPKWNQKRKELVAFYHQQLSALCPAIDVPFLKTRGNPAYHIMPVLLPSSISRNDFYAAMKEKEIQTSFHYPPVHTFSAYQKMCPTGGFNLPLTEQVASREVTLPLYPSMTNESVNQVINAIVDILN